jgi:hypothetical protein
VDLDAVVDRFDLDSVRTLDLGKEIEVFVQESGDAVALQGVECRGVRWWVDLGGQLIFHTRESVTRFESSVADPAGR